MKRFELIKLQLRNFKGIKEFTLEANGNDLKIKGGNATGKTTLFDAFTFLLFGKDSSNKTDFEIKALDENGKVKRHGLDHEVEGEFQLDGSPFTLKRVYAEKWTKKKGSIKETFSGHTTKYFIDETPVNKKEFDEKVSSIISEDVFKLLTNPLYFNQQLGWKERREILLSIAGDITNEEVVELSGNDDLTTFLHKLNGKSIDDYKKTIQSKMKKINAELDKIPVRMDEIELSLPDVSGLKEADLLQDLAVYDKHIEEKQEVINDIRSGGEVSKKRKELSDLDLKIAASKNKYERDNHQAVYTLKSEISEKKAELERFNWDINTKQMKIEWHKKEAAALSEQIEELRNDWKAENKKQFEHQEACECPTCGQDLPDEHIEAAREKAQSDFNKKKSDALESIQEKAAAKKFALEEGQKAIEKLQHSIDEQQEEKKRINAEIKDLTEKLESTESAVPDLFENQDYLTKMQKKEEIEKEIQTLLESASASIDTVKQEIEELKRNKQEVQLNLDKIRLAARSHERIKELEAQEEKLSQEYEELERDLYLSDEFTRKKVEFLEEKINSKFNLATFKLFSDQLNGGLKETCDTLYNGVPYEKGLNNAAKINVGLDIINTLQSSYGLSAPIFVDNAESVVKMIDIDTQVIALMVEDTKQLEVEKINAEQQTA